MDFKVKDGYKLPQSTIDAMYKLPLKPDQLEVGRVYMMISTHNGKHEYGGPTHMFLCCAEFNQDLSYYSREHKYIVSLYNGLLFSIQEAERVGYSFRELNQGEKVEFNQ